MAGSGTRLAISWSWWVGLVSTFLGLIVAHTTIAIPFVVITVSASLERYEPILTRAALICGAHQAPSTMRMSRSAASPSARIAAW